MSGFLRVGALEMLFALVFTVLALYDVGQLRRQRRQLEASIQTSRLEARRVAELWVENANWQRQYRQARALIELMGEFNQVMDLQVVLDRLTQGLSRFFAGDGVAIWILGAGGNFELAARVMQEVPSVIRHDEAWLRRILDGTPPPVPPSWVEPDRPWMAAALLDLLGQQLGVVMLTSDRRTRYTADDITFLRAILGHAAMAIQNAARFEIVDTLSRLDALTGLGNRGEFDRSLRDEVAGALLAAMPLSLLLADIDYFKQVNDSYGHVEGDRVLKEIAQLIAEAARAPNTSFRLGGEEFAVLLGEAKAAAVSIAEMVCSRVEHKAFFDNGARLTLSIGVASLPEDGREPAGLMVAADQALYKAKSDGRNRVRAA